MLKHRVRASLLTAAFIGIFLALVGCGGAQTPVPTQTPTPTDTSVQFSWVHTIEFVGFYEAVRQNYYSQANLNVRLDNGGYDASGAYIDPVTRVVSGQDDFGIAGADVILRARAEGKPLVAIAAIYQRSPVVLMSLKSKNITRPEDMVGKRVMTEFSNTVGLTYEALLASQGIDRSRITELEYTSFTLDPLINDETDVLSGFITNEAVQAQARHLDINMIVLSDYGIDIYSNVIFTTEDTINNKRDMVEAFLKATTSGIQHAVENPESAAQYVIDTYGQAMEPDIRSTQLAGLQASLPLLNPAGSHPGMMKAEDWQAAYQILLDQGVLTQSFDLSKAYNLTFLNQIYGQ